MRLPESSELVLDSSSDHDEVVDKAEANRGVLLRLRKLSAGASPLAIRGVLLRLSALSGCASPLPRWRSSSAARSLGETGCVIRSENARRSCFGFDIVLGSGITTDNERLGADCNLG